MMNKVKAAVLSVLLIGAFALTGCQADSDQDKSKFQVPSMDDHSSK